MTKQERLEQDKRIKRFQELEKLHDEISDALQAVITPWPSGPCGQGPFTGNYRESRQVTGMKIQFSATRGGAYAVDCEIQGMHIEASELGKALEKMLRDKLEIVRAEMEKI